MIEGYLGRYAALCLARPWLLVLAGVLAFLAGLPGAVTLYTDLRTDLRELLPRGAPAATALDALEKRVGGFGNLSVIIDTGDLKAGERFADALGKRLNEKLVPTLAREIRWRIDEDKAYVEAHGALYADLADLDDLNQGLKAEIDKRKVKAAGMDLGLDDDEAAVAADKEIDPRLDRVAKKLKARTSEQEHFLDGYLAGEGGRTLAILVMPLEGTASLDFNQRLFGAVEAEVRALDPKAFHPSIRIGYTGEVRSVIEAQEQLIRDMELSGILVLFAVGAVILGYYRNVRALPILLGPLFVGATLTFAAGRVGIGYLNPNTAFLGSIIIGNGINPGIILLARYFEERKGGASVEDALPRASINSWRATFTASFAATASYACLGVTGFRGFNQFAFLGGVGMGLVWITTYLLMPPLIVLFERRAPLAFPGARWAPATGRFARPFSVLLSRLALPATLLSLALTVFSGLMVGRFAKDPLEYNFDKLGSRQGAIDGAAYWGDRLDAVMQSYLTPTVILTDSTESAATVRKAILAEKDAEGATSAIATVATLDDVLPADQDKKLALLKEILGQLSDRVMKAVPEEHRAQIERLRKTTQARKVTLDDVPDHIGRLFKEKDGKVGRLVLVYPSLTTTSAHGRKQIGFARSLRATAAAADPKAMVAGMLILSADIIESITRDGFTATSLSFVAVALLTALVIGSLRHAGWVIGSLMMGTLWMGGALGLWALKLNFVNFAVLPITFGIGIDYAVNLYERYRELGPGHAAEALASSGGAVALCSLTTIIGYSALLVADNQA
ncbi:MAG: MMPL family transporter, partial [Minicystis sp.]